MWMKGCSWPLKGIDSKPLQINVLEISVVLHLVLLEGNGTPLQYSCQENPMDGEAWQAAVHGVAKSRTWLSDFTFTFHFYALEKEMATHSSVLAWRIPGMGKPGGLPSLGSHRVGHDWSDLAAASFKSAFSLPSFTLIKRLNSSSSLSAIRVISSAHVRLLIFLLVILISACDSSSPACLMTYCIHKINKKGVNIQPWRTPFPIWNQFIISHLVLTVASWPAYRFLRRQVRWSGILISLRIFPVCYDPHSQRL